VQSSPDADPLQSRRRRALFRASHRGSHENDILIGGFVAARIGGFDAAELDELEALLDLPDPDLNDFLLRRRPIPPELDSPLLRAMKDAADR
jgi:antitoxin CptB